jgi:adenylate cyclase
MARLVFRRDGIQQGIDLLDFNTLGRHPDNSIQVLDQSISRMHCQLRRQGHQFVVRDLDTRNGTFVNGERVVGERLLRHGDELEVGSWRATFDSFDAPGRSSAPPVPIEPEAPLSDTRPGTAPIPAVVAEQVAEARRAKSTIVDVVDSGRAIDTQLDATHRGFVTGQRLASNVPKLIADYERLRLTHELSRQIALESDLPKLLDKILHTACTIVGADRGVVFLKDGAGALVPTASLRNDGSDAPIAVSSTILGHVMSERRTVLTGDAQVDFGRQAGSVAMQKISSAIVAPLLHEDDLLGVLWLDSHKIGRFKMTDLELVTTISAQAAMFIEINALSRRIGQEAVAFERLSRVLSPNIAEKVRSGDMIVQRGGHLVECTVLNSDIRGFTRLARATPPQDVVEMLNEYFEKMVDAIFSFDGTLDKFMGDGIMALWGAPVAREDDAKRAVRSAIEQLRSLDELNAERHERTGAAPLEVGVGIHTGKVVAGYIGSSRALSYTVIGDTANTSARLCGIARGGQILVSRETLEQLDDEFDFEQLPAVTLKGLERPIPVFEIKR